MKILFPLLLITLFLGCKQPAKQSIVINKPPPFSNGICDLPNGNKLIFTENVNYEYLKSLKTGIKNTDNLYRQIIIKHFGESWRLIILYVGGHNIYSYNADTAFFVNYLSSIEGNEKKVKELIIPVLADANKILKNDSCTVYVSGFEKEQRLMDMGGVDIFHWGGNTQLRFFIDTTVATWPKMLKYCVVREFYMDYWVRHCNRNVPQTILLSLIVQGRADYFAHLIYPEINCPWNNALDEVKNEKHFLRNIKPSLDSSSYIWRPLLVNNHSTMYNSYCYTFTLGYHVVQSALKNHPELTPEQWTNLPPEKILEMSGYK